MMTNASALTHASSAELSLEMDQLILTLLGRDPTDRELAREKEVDLGELFATLSIDEAKALYHRLTLPEADDLVAVRFALLPYEGRSRLTLFLADARRRAAHHIIGYR